MNNGTKYLLREFYKLCDGGVCKDFLTEQEKVDISQNGAMYLTGIAQRADVKNGNGRIYPYKTLFREVENYKKLIRDGRSVGECVDEETEIFTTSGWKKIKNIKENEEIFTLDVSTNKLCKEIIQRKIVLPFSGKLFHFKNKNNSIDMMLTPNHNILLYDRYNNPKTISAKDAFFLWKERNSSFSHSYMKSDESNPHMDFRFLNIEEVDYNGNVYCVTTKNGNWLMRRNQCVVWTKNCDHTEDTVINLKNASHKIVDIWWEGKDVMVKLKVLSSPSGQIIRALVNDGVAIGLSSRGLGSVQETNEGLMVEDDLSLICFDIVSEPSTKDAFMHLNEAKTPLVLVKSDKIYRMLRDVLSK